MICFHYDYSHADATLNYFCQKSSCIFIISDLETLVVVDVPTQHPAIICLSAMLEQIKKIPPSPLGPHHN